MRLSNPNIPEQKLTRYLLVPRDDSDKSGYLALAGFTRENPELLKAEWLRIAEQGKGVEAGSNAYGIFIIVDGHLHSPNQRELRVRTIWMNRYADNCTYFVISKEGRAVMLKLYDRVALRVDVPEHKLCKGDIAVLVDFVPHPDGGERGCVLEVFNAVGDTIATVALPESAVEPVTADEILSIRHIA